MVKSYVYLGKVFFVPLFHICSKGSWDIFCVHHTNSLLKLFTADLSKKVSEEKETKKLARTISSFTKVSTYKL